MHGENGLGNVELPEPVKQPEADDALTCLRRWIEGSAQPVTIIAVGPLTNIALLLKAYPHLRPASSGSPSWAAAAFRGNASPAAEFNIYVDPEAARMVFKAGIPMIMCGLDVTMKAYATGEDIDAFAALGHPGGQILRRHLPLLL